jgi:hypothetical protein
MKIQRVYIDTSVIGGCLDQEFAVWSKGLLRDFQEGNLLLVVSTTVAAEVAGAYEAVQVQYEDFLQLEPEILEVTEQSIALAEAYQQRESFDAEILCRWATYSRGYGGASGHIGELELQAYCPLQQDSAF